MTSRRSMIRVLQFALAAVVTISVSAYSSSSWSQAPGVTLPDQIRIIVPFATGGSNDIAARIFSPYLQKELGVRVIVVNIKGGSGNNGLTTLANAKPDGSTLATYFTPMTHLLPKLGATGYDPKTLTPIMNLTAGTEVLLTAVDSKLSNLKDVAAALKAGKDLTIGVAGYGSNAFIASALLKRHPEFTKVRPVPYQGGGEVRNAIIGGHISLAMMGSIVAIPSVRSGQMKALAIAGSKRVTEIANVATAAEHGYKGIEVNDQLGLMGPPGMDAALVKKIAAAGVKAASNPEFVAKAAKAGLPLDVQNSEDYTKVLDDLSKVLDDWKAAVNEVGRPGQ